MYMYIVVWHVVFLSFFSFLRFKDLQDSANGRVYMHVTANAFHLSLSLSALDRRLFF
jgi:hypothetical protein